MAVYFEDRQLVDTESSSEFNVTPVFQRVLSTLAHNEPVPDPLLRLGIATEQVHREEWKPNEIAEKVLSDQSALESTSLSLQTVRRIEWLLAEVGSELPSERKLRIGELIKKSSMNVPAKHQPEAGSAERHTQGTRSILSTLVEESATDSAVEESSGSSTSAEKDGSNAKESSNEANTKTPESNYTCEFCGNGFEELDRAISHSGDCPDRPAGAHFECDECGNKYTSKLALDHHANECIKDSVPVHQQTDHQCSHCGDKFDFRRALLVHENSCSESGEPEEGNSESGVMEALGYVNSFDREKGYGFITRTDSKKGDKDLFVHISDVDGHSIETGDSVAFNVKQTEKGRAAVNVEITSKSHSSTIKSSYLDDRFASTRAKWGKDQ